MTPEHYQLIGQLFDEALERVPDERVAYLEQACGADSELRAEVEKLLASHSDSEEFLSCPAFDVAATLFAQNQVTTTVGKQIRYYEIQSLLGVGGMGQVYLARDTRLNRKVALKLLPSQFTRDAERVYRFEQEAQAASALNHPNILTIFDIGQPTDESDSLHFIATEYVEGKTLRQLLQEGRLSPLEVIEIGLQLSDALSAAHAIGIVHRDIKPENVMRRTDGYVKVLDFGLAKLIEQQHATQLTDPGKVMGTISYMSPEQALGQPVDGRTDIFSLGIVLYEMLTGKTPFAGGTASEVIAAILQNEPAPLGALLADVPRELESIVKKTLRKSREERYQTINDVLLDLRDLKSELDFQSKLEHSSPSHRTDETLRQTTDSRSSMATAGNRKQGIASATTTRLPSRVTYFLELLRRHKALAVICILVGATFIGFGGSFIKRYLSGVPTPLRAYSMPMKQTRVTTVGSAREARVSPDGQSVAYISREGAQYAIYLWQATENHTLTVLSPSNDELTQLDFAPDGQHIYYNRKDHVQREIFHLYRVPTFGGASEKLITQVDSLVSFGPGGREIAFKREDYDNRKSTLLLANADGTGERVLVERDLLVSFVFNPAWSPDGKTMVSWINEAIPDLQEFSLVAINVADGSVTPIGSKRWRWPGTITWMPDGKELLVNAIANAGERDQIFRVAYPSGDILRVTNDFNKYEGVSVTADGSSLVTVQGRQDVNIYVAPADESMNLQRVTEVTGVVYHGLAWTPDGRIVYGSNTGGKRNIWIIEANGTHLQQLTNDDFVNYNPIVTPDGRYIIYQCERTGRANIWRINLDGSNPIQLTDGDIELNPSITPDSQWVVYQGKRNEISYLGKVPIDGGQMQEIVPNTCNYPKVSPDGKTIACEYWVETYQASLSIIPFDGGKPIKSFVPRPADWQWATDSRSLILVDHTAGFSNLFRASMANNSRKPLTNFKSDRIFAYAFSRDGKKIAMLRGSASSEVVIFSNFH